MPVTSCFEIMNQSGREQTPHEALKKFARVFIDRSESKAITVSMHLNEDGIWYEDDAPRVLNAPFDAEELGNAIAEAMAKTDRRTKSLRDSKLSEWPAYKASRERTVGKFEESFIPISIEGANPANLVVIVTCHPDKGGVLHVTSSISTSVPPAELGERVLQVYKACRDRRL